MNPRELAVILYSRQTADEREKLIQELENDPCLTKPSVPTNESASASGELPK
jgi:hypothetical protein